MIRLRVGETVRRPIYLRSQYHNRVLLLSPGQRIESEYQLRRLQTEGCWGDPTEQHFPEPMKLAAAAVAGVGDAIQTLGRRTVDAGRVKQALAGAVRDLLKRVDTDGAPDGAQLIETSTMLADEVAADPTAVAAVTHLHRCDNYTVEHSADVAILMAALGSVMGMGEEDLRLLAMAGLVHDVGKQHIAEAIVQKPGPLNKAEMIEMRKHPEYGYEALRDSPDCPEPVRLVALEHHERLNGAGYPYGHTGEKLHFYSRIAAVADVFDAMTADRVYRAGMSPRQALGKIFAEQGTLLDAEVVGKLIKLIGVYPVGLRVFLDTGESGTVQETNLEDGTRPVVLLDRDQLGNPMRSATRIDLRETGQTITRSEG